MSRLLPFALLIVSAAMAACEGTDDQLGVRSRRPSSGEDPANPNNPADPMSLLPVEQQKFLALHAELEKKCGNSCHTQGTYRPEPPKFLEGATPEDAYKTIKAHPGMVTRDVYQSGLLTKGPHAGPALSTDPEFEKKIVEWLEFESVAIQSQKLPSSDPVAVKQGANEIDLSPVSGGKIVGVKLKFEARLVAGILSLEDMKLVAPAGQDVHIQQPKFVRVLAAPRPDGQQEVVDPADTFSNVDQTVPGGKETTLASGVALFSGDGWKPFDLASDKIRIEAVKLEPGKVSVVEGPRTCKNVQGFAQNVLPALRGQAGGFNLNCASCHGNGLAGLALNGNNNELICNQVLEKMTAPPNVAQSLIIQKVIAPANVLGHSGGKITNTQGWTQVFTNNQAVFF